MSDVCGCNPSASKLFISPEGNLNCTGFVMRMSERTIACTIFGFTLSNKLVACGLMNIIL